LLFSVVNLLERNIVISINIQHRENEIRIGRIFMIELSNWIFL